MHLDVGKGYKNIPTQFLESSSASWSPNQCSIRINQTARAAVVFFVEKYLLLSSMHTLK
jgi:hypothetical protein